MKIAMVLNAPSSWAKLSALGVVSGVLALCPHIVSAADHTVRPDGSGNFTTIQACANAAQTGDTCLVSAGIYPEHPSTVREGVTFKALGTVTMKGWRIRHPNITIDGFDITKYAVGLDQAHIRVEPEADGCQIMNNTIRDGIYLSSTGFRFDRESKTITNPAGGFIAAGFVPGSSIYIASNINQQILNHDNNSAVPYRYETKIVKAVTDTTLTLIETNTVLTEGPVFAAIYVNAAEKQGVWGVLFIASTTRGVANGCRITGNRFANLAGTGLHLLGSDHVVDRNIWERMNGWRMIGFAGNRNQFHDNVFRDSPRLPGFDAPVPGTVFAKGSGSWDFYATWITSLGAPDLTSYDNVFERNFVLNIDEQLATVEDTALGQTFLPTRGLLLRHNVFVGVEMAGSFTRPDTRILHNTFARSAYVSAHVFIVGASNHGNPVGSVIQHNVFLDSGRLPDPTGERGWYSTRNAANQPTAGVTADYNAVSPQKAQFAEAHGVNAADLRLRNAADPLGPDGLPFTLDDGLKPLPNSPLCGKGDGGTDIGVYSCDPLKVFAERNSVPLPTAPTNLRILR